MPTGVDTVIRGLLQEQAQRGRGELAQQSMALRMQQQQALNDYRKFMEGYHNQMAGYSGQRLSLAQQKLSDTEQQNKAFSDYVMQIDDNDPAVAPDMKMQLRQIKAYIANNPGRASSGVAKEFLPKVKSSGWQLVATPGIDLDGNPTTFYAVYDKTRNILGPAPTAPGTFTGALPGATTPAPAKKSPGDALIDKYLGGP